MSQSRRALSGSQKSLADAVRITKRKIAQFHTLLDDHRETDIKPPVIAVLSIVSGHPRETIKEVQKLAADLHLNAEHKASLAVPFTKVARHFNPGAVIGRSECATLSTVKASIDLVYGRSIP
jgi:hypothetical protein